MLGSRILVLIGLLAAAEAVAQNNHSCDQWLLTGDSMGNTYLIESRSPSSAQFTTGGVALR